MNIKLEEIEKLLYATPGNRQWLDLLAPQEIDRFVFLVMEALSKAEMGSENANFNSINGKFIEYIVKELKELEDLFGIKNLASRLNWTQFLKQLYPVT